MKRLAILGASGHGKVVADAALASGWDVIVFFDDAWPETSSVGPWPVQGATGELLRDVARWDGVVVAIGVNATRLRKHRELAHAGAALATIVHPKAVVSPWATVGVDTVIFAGAVVNPFARIGDACIINTSASVDHDCQLADGVHISPGAHLGGNVSVGEASWIGLGASIKHGITVGSGVVVGAGAVVVMPLADGLTAVGVPARPVEC